jgi:hypothetical protein
MTEKITGCRSALKSGAKLTGDEVRLRELARAPVLIHVIEQNEWRNYKRDHAPPSKKQGRESERAEVFPNTWAAQFPVNFFPLPGN